MFVWDMGVFDQMMWNTAHGRLFQSSLEVENFLGDHFCPILALFAPLHHILPSPFLLMAIQCCAYAAAAGLVGTIVLKHTRRPQLAWAAAALMAFHPSSFSVIVQDFSVLCLVVPLTIALYWWARQGRTWGVAAMMLALLVVREDAPIAMAAVGILLAAQRDRRRLAALLIGVGCVAPIVGQWVVVPFFRGGQVADSNYRLTVTQAPDLWSIVTTTVFGRAQWSYIVGFFAAFGGVLLLTGWRVAAVIFAMGHLLLMPSTLGLSRHYVAVPFSVAAVLLIILFCDLWPRFEKNARSRAWVRGWLIVTLCISGGWFSWREGRTRLWVLSPDARVADFTAVAQHVPPDAAVAASSNVGSRIAHREALYLWPHQEYSQILQSADPIQHAAYIFADRHRETVWGRPDEIQKLRSDPLFELVAEQGDFSLFRRTDHHPREKGGSPQRPAP
jgi:hypothetical protein